MGWQLVRSAFSAYYKSRFRRSAYLVCIRVNIRPNKWDGKSHSNPAHLLEAIKDLEVKPKDKGGLSLYVVRSKRQARLAVLIHQITNNVPEPTHFLCLPASCIVGLSCNPQIVREWSWLNQHPLLNKYHFVVYGLQSENARLELASAILRHPDYRLGRWTKKKVMRLARKLTRKWHVRIFMKDEQGWRRR